MAPPQPQQQRSPASSGIVKHALTATEKILARASEKTQLVPGENVWVKADILMTHDVGAPGTIGIFKREFGKDAKVHPIKIRGLEFLHIHSYLYLFNKCMSREKPYDIPAH